MTLPVKLLLACWLLSVNTDPPAGIFAFTRQSLHAVAIGCELMDEREAKYVLVKEDELLTDLQMIRRRRDDLKDAPFLADHLLFTIDRRAVNAIIVLNREATHVLQGIYSLYPHRHDIGEQIDRLKEDYDAWDALRDAQCDYYYIHIRRQALGKLRKILGDDAMRWGWVR